MAIEGGSVVWRISADLNNLRKGVMEANQAAGGLVQKLRKHSMAVGKAMTAIGTAGIASAVGVARNWAAMGDEIAKASRRTGLSTESMSVFRHAAEQTGAGMESVESGFKRMARFAFDAQRGTSTATEALQYMGLSAQDIVGLAPEQMFWTIAEAIRAVGDPMMQAALAQEAFGRGGTQLLPLINEGAAAFAEYRREAESLGIVFSEEMGQKAEAFTDRMDELAKAFRGLAIAIGPLVAENLTPFSDWLTENLSKFKDWRAENDGLAGSMVEIGIGASAVMIVLGPFLMALSSLIGIVTKLWPALKLVGGFLSTGLAAAVAAAVAAWVLFAVEVEKNWDNVKKLFSDGWEFVKETFGTFVGGAMDLFEDFWEAAKLMLAGKPIDAIKTAWEGLKEFFGGIFDWFTNMFSEIASTLYYLPAEIGRSIGGMVDGFIPGFQTPQFASGGITPGGLVRVGEGGPEVVELPKGSRVFSARESQSMGGVTVNLGGVTINDGSDAAQLARAVGAAVRREMGGMGMAGVY